jgi:hypothetical protein
VAWAVLMLGPMSIRFALPLLLVACDAPPAEPLSTCRTGSGVIATNGSNMNGTSLRRGGWDANGVDWQGTEWQGVELQGISMQGIWSNGIWENGVWGNGMQFQGISQNGMQFQGVGHQGSNLNGIIANGTIIGGLTTSGEKVELVVIASEQRDGLTFYALATKDGANICGEGVMGLFVPGIWDSTGQRHETLGEGPTFIDTTFSCTTGVIAKCVVWGYDPGETGAELHQTCTRMARADYCGDGVPHTVNGTLIDLYDIEGIQVPVPDGDLPFEAGWGPNGAICVHKPRYRVIGADGRQDLPSCWSDKPQCGGFEEAIAHGALIGNSSGHMSRYSCEE